MNRRFSAEHVEWPPIKKPDGGDEKIEEEPLRKISKWRVAFPQILAASAKNMLLLDLGMTVGFSTIVIPVLKHGEDALGLTFNNEEASWFSSIVFVCQPLGSIFSGFIMEPLGRKMTMILVNIPHIAGWLMLYVSTSKALVYVAAAIMGLGIGFMEAPTITYISEIAQPSLRGTLTSYSNLFVTFGIWLIFFLGAVLDWRTAALVSALVPTMTVFIILQVPETPIWLLSKGRREEAERALRWLRGWVSSEHVKDEFNKLTQYAQSVTLRKNAKTGVINRGFLNDDGTAGLNNKDYEDLSLGEKARDFMRPGMMKPMLFIIAFFLFSNFTGVTSTRPYIQLIAEELQMPLKPSESTMIFGAIGFIGSVLCMVTIAMFKKRPIALFSLAAAAVCGFCMCFSKDPWVTFIAYSTLTFASLYGASGLVWTLVSEVFPYRGRGLASGIAAAASYLMSFAATKSYQSLVDWLTLQGVFAFYGSMSLIGLIFVFFCMPETEGRPLEEIENNFEEGLTHNGKRNSATAGGKRDSVATGGKRDSIATSGKRDSTASGVI